MSIFDIPQDEFEGLIQSLMGCGAIVESKEEAVET
jgi:hypothetical protein